MSKEDKAVPDF